APAVLARFAFDRHSPFGKDRGCTENRPMVLAAVETVTNTDPIGATRRHDSNVAAQAATGESVHVAAPSVSNAYSFLQRTARSCSTHALTRQRAWPRSTIGAPRMRT